MTQGVHHGVHIRALPPLGAVSAGGVSGDPTTIPDLTWEPFGSPNTDGTEKNFIPPLPAYPLGHVTSGDALFAALCLIFPKTGDETPFVLVSDEFNAKQKRVNDLTLQQ